MKGFKILVLLLLMVASAMVSEAKMREKKAGRDRSVLVLSTKRHIFYFKINRQYRGGSVKVYNERNEMVAEEMLVHHKMLIDFHEVMPGKYIIRVENGTLQHEFTYIKE